MNAAKHSARFLPPRSQHIARIKELTERIASQSERIFGIRAFPALAFELEFSGILNDGKDTKIKVTPKGQFAYDGKLPFGQSAYIEKFGQEAIIPGATEITLEGEPAIQLEIVVGYERSERTIFPSRRLTPVETAELLREVPKLLERRAQNYGMKRVDFRTVVLGGEFDQPNSLHMHISMPGEDGRNLFDDGTGHASELHRCFIEASLEFDKDAMIIYAPTDNSFNRFRSLVAPKCHFLFPRRKENESGTLMIRGQNYETWRAGDPNPVQDKGGVRLEHRLPSPEAVVLNPEEQPYIFVETYLIKLLRAFEIYEKRRQEKTFDQISEEKLREIRHEFPTSLEEARTLFLHSDLMEKIYGQRRCDILDAPQVKNQKGKF